MFDLVFQNLAESSNFNSKFFERILNISAEELNLSDKKIGVSISLVGEERITDLNLKYRNKNKSTDVLSFPLANKEEVDSWLSRPRNPDILDLGDIFICLSFAKKEAKSENVDIERKLAQLTVHGLLHLLGYDHERSEDDEVEMFRLEKQILNSLK